MTATTVAGAAIGVGVGVLLKDVIMGIASSAAFIAITSRIVKLWLGPMAPASHAQDDASQGGVNVRQT
jgi:hypothetical protein